MNPARLQHVTRILRQLPQRSTFLPLARYSSSRRNASGQTACPSTELPKAFEFNKPQSLDDLEKVQLSPHWTKIFEELDIGTPANDYRIIYIPHNLKAKSLTRFRISKRHVMRAFDTGHFTENKYEHPKAVLMRYYYEEDKKNKPLWLWFYGISTDTPAVVSMAKYRMKLALHAALKNRGYDVQGRLIDPESETGIGTALRGDLKGTIACVAKSPRDVVKKLPKKELRLAMDALVDAFIRVHETEQMKVKEKGQAQGAHFWRNRV
ncbi:uncharacterized protein GLRG_02411 [Colletotrichum graminicola M1.001]|uniref:Uncharacterized protein n=1 Tax=Colletotrichum graminicola (strain M1.001 / M2 / FGSC 10212) TaxID=645133 RepID=E3Q6V3_COLGM|nr:uncharacterized protein GLRG_02411 [Colletotrichum graminicola M1.001]EFQ26591.1 hypothetical protein GLRG_02411 [Colletotrichum graminicola M1.001]